MQSKEHVTIPYDASIAVSRPMSIKSSKGSIISFCQTINFIDNWIQYFEDNYDNHIVIYKENMSVLFKTIPTYIPPRN